ncbi:MAG: type I restriction-modification system subunit M [Oscillospiraceae bacterium]|nr:type I restriction-modification system subunit M [Oscillospiraceae bacterium]
MNKQQLASKIWESANRMRSKIEANEYKDYILGFIFYKFLSDKEVKYLKENDWTDEYLPELTEEDGETVESIQKNLGYFIAYENLFSSWITKGIDFSAEDVTDALSAFSRLINPTHKKVFDNIFATLQTGLSKLGETSGARTKAIRDLIYLIKDIPMDGKQDYDVLGFIYEYLISNFAANAGKKAGEFYTPHEVSLLMSEIVAQHLKGRAEIKIYDPTSGSGSLLINIGRCVARYMGSGDHIMYYAQELKENTYNLTRMNLVMRGILPDNIMTRNGDTLEEDWPYFDENDPVHTYDTLYADAVVSNPPYSQAWNSADKESDPRYAQFGLAPKGKADYAFLLHDLFHLKPDGIMTIVLPHGVLFRGGEEGAIRKNLIERNHVDAIIGLPANIFFGTGIPTIIMVLKQKRDNTDVLIVDASKGFAKAGKNNILRACDIKRIVDVVTSRSTVEKFSKVVSRDDIRANDYNLNIPRYVDSSEKAERWDIFASMFGGIPDSELWELHQYWDAFPGLKDALFTSDNGSYCRLNVPELKSAVQSHPSVVSFLSRYEAAFHDFDEVLRAELLDKMQTLNTAQEESVLSDAIFSRLDGIPLVDRYGAYQLLDDEWGRIAVDLEIIQTEGFAAAKQVDPNMVSKKKDGKDQEVQEGWAGHVIPFALVQEALLPDALAALTRLETRLSELSGEYETLLEELSEEEKEQDFVNEGKDAFVPAEVKKALKAKEAEPQTLAVLKKADALITEEKALRRKIKTDSAELHLKTKATIEGLSDDAVLELLQKKWITPIVDSLRSLPDMVIADLVGRLETICKKYETTFAEVKEEIAGTERSLIALLDDLTGSEFDMRGLAEFKKLLGGE